MKKIIFILLILLNITIASIAEEITDFNLLLNNAKTYEQKNITVRGEIIGNKILTADKQNCWVNITDGIMAIGIWLTTEQAAVLSCFGDYKHRGDIINVTGKFFSNCQEHNGEFDIHAQELVILEQGKTVEHNITRHKQYQAIMFSIAALVLFIIYMSKRSRK